MAIALVSCNKDEDTDPLVGTWELTYTYFGTIYQDEVTFNSNHSGKVINKEDNLIVDEFSFNWSAVNNILSVSYDGETLTTIYSISGNKLTMDGEVYTRK